MAQQKNKKDQFYDSDKNWRPLAQLLKLHCTWHAQRYTTHSDQMILTFATTSIENVLI
jgi:hypothetical protein